MSNLVIILSKAILIQIIQTTWIGKNHFYVNISKHKSIKLNSLLVKIKSVKINSIKINYLHRRTKHALNYMAHSLSYCISIWIELTCNIGACIRILGYHILSSSPYLFFSDDLLWTCISGVKVTREMLFDYKKKINNY